jgi:sensor histidine kinase YesM
VNVASPAEAIASGSEPLLKRVRWPFHWFAGLTWKGMALVALLCLLNAIRRTGRYWDGVTPNSRLDVQFVEWMIMTVQATASGLIVAIPVALSVVVTWNIVPPLSSRRYPALVLAVAGSCVMGIELMDLTEAWTSRTYVEHESLLNPFVIALVRYGLLAALVAVVFVYLRVAHESAARAQDAERDRSRFVQRMEEARLKMLQAQIEPHFLFNTLATVSELYQTAASEGQRMLDELMRYLAAALPQLRAADSTLGGEVALTSAYLSIQQIRMARRLKFDIEVAERLRSAPFPPLMLLTLAENAVKHGLAPLPQGGSIRIDASYGRSELQVRVIDSGCGFAQSSGSGTGLANIRARLSTMYGEAARLSLTRNDPHGVVVTIAIPLSAAPRVVDVS